MSRRLTTLPPELQLQIFYYAFDDILAPERHLQLFIQAWNVTPLPNFGHCRAIIKALSPLLRASTATRRFAIAAWRGTWLQILNSRRMMGLEGVCARDTLNFIDMLAEGLEPEEITAKFKRQSYVYG